MTYWYQWRCILLISHLLATRWISAMHSHASTLFNILFNWREALGARARLCFSTRGPPRYEARSKAYYSAWSSSNSTFYSLRCKTLSSARGSLLEALCSRLSARGPLLPPPLAYEAHLTQLFSIDTRLPRLNVLKDNMFSLARSSLWHNVPAVVMSLFFFCCFINYIFNSLHNSLRNSLRNSLHNSFYFFYFCYI